MLVLCILGISFTAGDIHADVIDDYPVPKEEIEVKDHDSFIEAHRDELNEYNGEFKDELEKQDIILWEYPFSSEKTGKIKEALGNLSYQYIYMDSDNSKYLWGYIEYDKDTKGWLCFNQPNNEDMGIVKHPQVETSKDYNVVVLVVLLLVLLIVGTLVIMKVVWKKEKK